MRWATAIVLAALGAVSLPGCSGPHVAPNLPVKGDHRYHGYTVVEARLRALNARDLDKLDTIYSADAVILDSEGDEPRTVGLAAIKARYARLLATCADAKFDVVKRS